MRTTRHNPNIHHRRSVRLREYDYRSFGAYFITICTYERRSLFGNIREGEVTLSEMGAYVRAEWMRTAEMRPHVMLDAFVVMPNHFHAVVLFEDMSLSSENDGTATSRACCCTPLPQAPVALGAVVNGFKASVTTRINTLRNTPGVPVWQRNYHEHIVRSGASLQALRKYVATNPARWYEDVLHPEKASNTFSL